MTPTPLVVTFTSDIPGRDLDSFDFGALGVPRQVALPLMKAFRAVVSLYRSASRRQGWASVRKFCVYLKVDPNPAAAMRRQEVLKNFLSSMLLGLGRNTSSSHYNFIAALYRWLGINDADNAIVWLNVDAGPCNVVREVESKRRNVLSERDLSRILAASKNGIDEVRERMSMGESARLGRPLGELSAKDAEHLKNIWLGACQGSLGKPALVAAGFLPPGVGYRRLRQYTFLDSRDFIPYIVYIICESLMNPQSAMELSIHCVRDHPVDPLKRQLMWDKYRSGGQQMLDVSVDGRYSVPKLVGELLQWSLPLRREGHEHCGRLFVSQVQGSARTPSVQSWHNSLQDFIVSNRLPEFNFVDIRLSGAKLLDDAGLPLQTIREKMQHRDSRTTLRYIRRDPMTDRDRASIAKFIGQVVSQATKSGRRKFETVTGLNCVDQESGVAPGSTVGNPCIAYLHCVVCPNSIAVLDSKKYVTRMASVLKTLDSIREKSFRDPALRARYEEAFRPTHEVLTALLRKVPKKILVSAMADAEELPLLALE